MRLVAGATLALALLAASQVGAAPRADAVTLSLRQYTNENKIRVFVWFGQIASNSAGEDIEVLGRDCLTKHLRLYTATRSASGGGYEVESAQRTTPYNIVDVNSGTTFRARWRDQLSNTILHKTPLPTLYALKMPKRRAWRVIVNPVPIYVVWAGRVVELQRFRAGKWIRYKTARLVRKPSFDYGGATNHEAVFEVPTRGLKLRWLVPTKTVAPCYFGKASEPWRS
jgi:hypothetical protein